MRLRDLIWISGAAMLVGIGTYTFRSPLGRQYWAIVRGVDPVLDCPTVLHFGERERGEIAVKKFTLANRGGRELIIDDVQSSCSCSGLERELNGKFVRVESLRLGPQESVELAMRISVQGTAGASTESRVVFQTNDPLRPEAGIDTLISKVNAGVSSLPTSVIFGKVRRGSVASQRVDIYDSSMQPRTFVSAKVVNPERVTLLTLPLSKDEVRTVHKDFGNLIGRLEVTAITDSAGPLETTVDVHLSDARPATEILVTGEVVGPVEITPSMVVLPRMSANGPLLETECVFRSTAGNPIEVKVLAVPVEVETTLVSQGPSRDEQTIRVSWKGNPETERGKQRRKTIDVEATTEGETVKFEIPILWLGTH